MRILRTAVAATLVGLAGAAARAQTTGSLTLDSQPGDYIGAGQAWQYDQTVATFSTSSDGSMVTASVWLLDNSGWWTVQLAAPPGQPLAVGSYENAVRASFRPAGSPGIDVSGMGRGCNQTVGRFDVSEVTFGPNNYVVSLSATFEQHCEFAGAPALFGEVHVQNPPPPPALGLGVSFAQAAFNKVTGAAKLGGVLSCNKPADVNVGVWLTQRISRSQVMRGWSSAYVHCEAPGQPIELVVSESSGGAFVKGRPVEISTNASSYDPAYGTWVTRTSIQVVKLK
jgi:hypothetical protein